ncbi:MAG TPA: helix-turn-helix domain-containing protein [Thermoanaerobaculia bacterium]|nr:helix-turn-helix domain-containing protein [Thermoanaerobaculia bacterium]
MSAATQQFGEELKRNRELKEVSREQLAAATKVSLRQIEALEMGRFDLLPALVFSRGFVRAIASLIGLDGEALVAEFTRLHHDFSVEQAESAVPLALGRSGAVPRLSRPRRAVSTDTTVRGLAIAAALALATAGAAILKSRSTAPSSASTSPSPARERAENGPASLGIPPAIAKATVALPPEAPRPEAEPAAAPADARPLAGSPPGSGGVTLTLAFQEDCWTELYADGKKLAVETFPKGTTREFSGFQKYTLTLGNAGGVRITVNGRPVEPLGPRGHVVHNVVIDNRGNSADG